MSADRPSEQIDLQITAPKMRAVVARGVWLTSCVLFGFVSISGWKSLVAHPATVFVLTVVIVAAGSLQAWSAWRKGDPASVVLRPDHIMVPVHPHSDRAVRIPLDKLWSVAVIGSRGRGRLVIATRWRSFVIPLHRLTDPASLKIFSASLRQAILAQEDGAAHWAAIETRNTLATDFGAAVPWGSLGAVVVLGIAAATQFLLLHRGDLSGMLYLGALVPDLVSRGEWFRLITANLLHTAPYHALADGILLWSAGTAAERLFGTRLMLLILLSTALVAQATAVLDGGLPSQQLLTVGLSGGVLGLCGALTVALRSFRSSLPAGLWPNVFGVTLIVLGVAATCWVAGAIDVGGVLAGGVAGACLGAMLCRGSVSIRSLRSPSAAIRLTSNIVVAAWVGGISIGIWQLDRPQSRTTEQSILAASMLASDRTPDQLQNEIAWEAAINPDASPALLDSAAELASRAVASATRADPKSLHIANYVDTLAALDFRRGDPALAMRRELAWIDSVPAIWPHFTEFLDRTLRERGIQILGEIGPVAPVITVGQGVLQLTVDEAAPAGARVFAILRNHDSVIGSLVFHIPPNYTGQQILPQPWANGSPSATAPPSIWSDPATTIEIALFDRRSCFCRTPAMGPTYIALPEASDLPPWSPRNAKLAAAP